METFALGPFAVAPDGTLAPRGSLAAPALCFAWRGRSCRAELGADGMRIAAEAARIPSSAQPGADRRRAFAALAGLPGRLPRGWQARLLPDHRVQMEAAAPLAAPANATALVAALVRFVLDLDPWIDALEAEGMDWPAGA